MVKFADILNSNHTILSNSKSLTAVFVGATNGIGLGALRAFAKHTSGTSPTIYIVGRSPKRLAQLNEEVSTLNASATIRPIQAEDLTLVKDAETAAQAIKTSAKKIDLLIMSPGYISYARDESSEGLDRVQAVRFYSRMRFLVTLAPLLRVAPNPRVVTVLGGGDAGDVHLEDLTLKKNYSLPTAAGQSGSLTTMFLHEFAKQPGNGEISLVHTFPGVTGGTGLSIKGLPIWAQFLLDWVATPLMNWFGYTIEETGERTIFAATSERFLRLGGDRAEVQAMNLEKGIDGNAGSGVYILNADSSVAPTNKWLKKYLEEGAGKQIWDHTMQVYDRAG